MSTSQLGMRESEREGGGGRKRGEGGGDEEGEEEEEKEGEEGEEGKEGEDEKKEKGEKRARQKQSFYNPISEVIAQQFNNILLDRSKSLCPAHSEG